MQKLSLTIRRKIILPIILTVFAVIGVTAFVACSDEVTEQDIINLGYSVGITYDNNGGIVGNKTDPQFARVKENSLIPTPGINAGIKIPSRAGYSFRGYFYAETDEDGNVKRNEDGSIVISDRQCEFGKHGVSDRDITLCAEWWENYKINLHYGEGQNEVKTVSVSRRTDGSPYSVDSNNLTESGYTFISYNTVKNGSADTAINISELQLASDMFDSNTLTFDIYAETLTGIYELIRSADDFALSALGEDTNYYIMNEIDLGDRSYDDKDYDNTYKFPKTYNGKFIGNGHTIRNFSVSLTSLDSTYNNFGLFRSLGAKAEISDVIFEDVTLDCSFENSDIRYYMVGMLAGQTVAGSKVDNVKVSGTFSYSQSDNISVDLDNISLIGSIATDSVVSDDSVIVSLKKIIPTDIFANDGQYKIGLRYSDIDGVRSVETLTSFSIKSNDNYPPTRMNIVESEGNSFVISVRDIYNSYRFKIDFAIGESNTITATVSEITDE